MGKAKSGKRNSAGGASPYAKPQKTNNVFKFNVRLPSSTQLSL